MFVIAGGWLIVSIAYVGVTSMRKSYSMKMISAMIRPESLSVLMQVLKDDYPGYDGDENQGIRAAAREGSGSGSGDPDIQFTSDKNRLVPKVRVDLVVNDWDVPGDGVMREALFTGRWETEKFRMTQKTR